MKWRAILIIEQYNRTIEIEDFDRAIAWLGEVVKGFDELMSYLLLEIKKTKQDLDKAMQCFEKWATAKGYDRDTRWDLAEAIYLGRSYVYLYGHIEEFDEMMKEFKNLLPLPIITTSSKTLFD